MGRHRRLIEWQPKTNSNWNAMSYLARREWLESLSDAQLIEQAGVRALATKCSTAAILDAWCVNGMIEYDRKTALKQQLAKQAA